MRMNVYNEEITGVVDRVEKTADNGIKFVGVRMYLASPDILHDTEGDDDRSAVTLWFAQDDLAGQEKVLAVLRLMTYMSTSSAAENSAG